MKIGNWAIIAGTVIAASAVSSQGQAADSDMELAFMPSTMTVTLSMKAANTSPLT